MKTLKVFLGVVVVSLSSSVVSLEVEHQNTERLDREREIIREREAIKRLERERELEIIRERAEREETRIREKNHEIGNPCNITEYLPVCP